MDDEEIRLSKRRRVELASQHLEGLLTLHKTALRFHVATNYTELGIPLSTESSLTRG